MGIFKKGWKWFVSSRVNQLFLSLGFLLASVVTGWCVFRSAGCEYQQWHLIYELDALLKAVALLVFDGFHHETTGIGELVLFSISRLCAVLFAASSAVAFAYNLIGNAWRILRVSEPVYIIGGGWKGRKIAEHLAETGKKMVVVDVAIDPAFEMWCALQEIGVVKGDATEEKTLKQARLHQKASKVYIFCGDDEVDMQVCHLVSKLVGPTRAGKPEVPCLVELKSTRLYTVLRNAIDPSSRLIPTLLNVDAITTRMLLNKYPIDPVGVDYELVHVIVMGSTSMAKELMRQITQMGHFESGKHLHLSVMVPDVDAFVKGFVDYYPAFESVETGQIRPKDLWVRKEHILPELNVYPMPSSASDLLHSEFSLSSILFPAKFQTINQAISVFVAVDNGAQSAGLAVNCGATLEYLKEAMGQEIQLFFYLPTGDEDFTAKVDKAVNESAPHLDCIAFEDFLGNYDPELIEGREIDKLAKRLNAMYCNALDDQQAHDNLWNGLSEGNKDSSRQAAMHGKVKGRIRERLAEDARIQEELPQVEHRRWCSEYLIKGFRPLVTCPSVLENPESWPGLDATELEHVNQWFGWADAPLRKQPWKARFYHVDLMPFEDIRTVLKSIGTPEAEAQAEREIEKDKDQIREVERYFEPGDS